jgi:hypothetical protein
MTNQKSNQIRISGRQTMKPFLTTLVVIIAATGTVGCSMCCGPYDFDYPTYGGKHERVDRAYGRVGSIFSDPNAGYYGESADSNLSQKPADRAKDRDLPDAGDDDMEQFRRELESVTPRETPPAGEAEELPQPDDTETDPTASRRWKNRPLRSGPQWR